MRGFSITGMILGIVGAVTGITAVVFSVLASGGMAIKICLRTGTAPGQALHRRRPRRFFRQAARP